MHNAALQPHGCAQRNARRVHMQCLIVHAFQYHSCHTKRNGVTTSLNDRQTPTNYRDPNNTAYVNARVKRRPHYQSCVTL